MVVATRSAYTDAINLLKNRDYSCAKITQKLKSKGHENIDIEAAISKLQAYGYLNDHRLAEGYIRSMINRNFSDRKIKLKLRNQGLSMPATSTPNIEETSEEERAQQLLDKKFAGGFTTEQKQKITSFLANRGFSWTTIYALLKKNARN